jgi:hypothetical protein
VIAFAKPRELWTALDTAYAVKDGVALQGPFRLAAYQTALTQNAPYDLLYNWRWKMPWWLPEDRTELYDTLQKAYTLRTAIARTNGAFGMIKPPKRQHLENSK